MIGSGIGNAAGDSYAINLFDVTFVNFLKLRQNRFVGPRQELGLEFTKKPPAWRRCRSPKVNLPLTVFE
jgi:hypothetical protein